MIDDPLNQQVELGDLKKRRHCHCGRADAGSDTALISWVCQEILPGCDKKGWSNTGMSENGVYPQL